MPINFPFFKKKDPPNPAQIENKELYQKFQEAFPAQRVSSSSLFNLSLIRLTFFFKFKFSKTGHCW